MKVSIKEIKVEEDGSELLYIRDFGFVLKSETFSGPLKRCLEKGKEKGKAKEIDLEAFIPSLNQIMSQVMQAQQVGAEAQGEAPPQTKEHAAEEKKKAE